MKTLSFSVDKNEIMAQTMSQSKMDLAFFLSSKQSDSYSFNSYMNMSVDPLLQLRVIRDDGTLACSEGPTVEDEHGLCGITLFGRTKNGTNDHYTRYRSYRNENGAFIAETDWTYIQTENMLEDAEKPSKFHFRFVRDIKQ